MSEAATKPRVRVPAHKAGHLPAMIDQEFHPVKEVAFGGSVEGVLNRDRQTALWKPAMGSADQIIKRTKPAGDARGRDMVQNDGYARGAVSIHQDSIVGAQYMLTAQPNLAVLNTGSNAGRSAPKFDETWEEEFGEAVENYFNLLAESEDCWLDASGTQTFTGLTRLAVGGFVWTGEVLASAEWIRSNPTLRPLRTALRMISPTRLSNENNVPDTDALRQGITRDQYGRATAYSIRNGYPTDFYAGSNAYSWTTVAARKPWGRKQILHIIEQREGDQSRGIADMVSALKHMRMTKNFSEITLQNAVVQASYAAAVESELPPEAVQAMMGANDRQGNFLGAIEQYMGALSDYVGESNGIAIDGVKIPHLFPGTKLQTKTLGTPGGIGQNFETSLLRHIAASLGISYEEFSRDYSRVSYSSARASMNTTGRFMRARKKMVADRFANGTYQLVFEEMMALGMVPLPRGVSREYFYVPLMKDAFTAATWTGSGTGQIDELKETQAAILRIGAGLSTRQDEIARLGGDWRRRFRQLAKEQALAETLGLDFTTNAQKSTTTASTQATLQDHGPEPDPEEEDAPADPKDDPNE